jgi:hypothetical protein
VAIGSWWCLWQGSTKPHHGYSTPQLLAGRLTSALWFVTLPCISDIKKLATSGYWNPQFGPCANELNDLLVSYAIPCVGVTGTIGTIQNFIFLKKRVIWLIISILFPLHYNYFQFCYHKFQFCAVICFNRYKLIFIYLSLKHEHKIRGGGAKTLFSEV